MGIPSLTVTNINGIDPFTWSQPYYVASCRSIAVASAKGLLQLTLLPSLPKAVGEANSSLKSQAFDLVHNCLSWLNLSNQPLQKKELIDAKVRDLLDNTQRLLSDIGQDYYVIWKQSQAQRDFLHQCERFCGQAQARNSALIEDGTPVLALLSDPILANHTREISKWRAWCKVSIAEENVAKIQTSFLTVHLSNLNGRTNTTSRLLCSLHRARCRQTT